ncbi:MAG: hypothetical protein A2583_14825 [Bdellovibrionales bacterium RIFOXYD1_FULL_53_11]|nr:MAG: hypothetical protein A2583_14825 [Bdellovibrionales bacterium RIFOXYD1_FULL_53_11]
MKQGFAVFAVAGLLVLSACSRSNEFKKDQEVYQEPQSYYNKATQGKSPTQRLESMGQPKKRVFVFDFWNDTPVKQKEAGPFAADELRRGLFATQRLILPTDLRSAFGTEDFVQGDRVKVAQLIREGRRMGVAVLVIGRVTKIIFRQRGDDIGVIRQKQSFAAVDVEVKMFDVAAGREIMAFGKSGETSSNSLQAFGGSKDDNQEFRVEMTKLALRNAIVLAVPEVIKGVEKMNWSGRVAKVASNKVYVNAGKASGLVLGDILKVLSQGDDIYDPATGAYLGRTQGQLKGTLEVVDFIGTDGAVTEMHTGGNFQEGDTVQLY